MGEGLLFGVEKLNGVFYRLLFLILVHHSQVVTLGMEIELKGLRVVKGLDSCLSGWNLDKTDPWVLGLTWKSGIDEEVSVWSPHDIFNSVNSDRFFNSIRSLNQLHSRQLIHTDTSFNLGGAILLCDVLLELLCKIVAIVGPHVDMTVFALFLIEVSDLLN